MSDTQEHQPETIPSDGETAAPDVPETEQHVEKHIEEPTAQPATEANDKPKPTPWFMSRIDQLNAKWRDEQRRADEYQRELQRFQSQQPKPAEDGQQQQSPVVPEVTPEAYRRAVQMEARQIAENERFSTDLNAMIQSGEKTFPDFRENSAVLHAVLQGHDARAFLDTLIATGNGHEVVQALGKDPDNAARILALPERRQAIELAKLALSPPKAKAVSSAPKPIKPVNTSTGSDNSNEELKDDISYAEWLRIRDKQASSRR